MCVFHLIYLVYYYSNKMMNNVFDSLKNLIEPYIYKLPLF